MISALRQQGGPSPLWSGARRFMVRRPGRHDNVVPLPASQAKIPVRSTVARSNPSAVDCTGERFLILIGIRGSRAVTRHPGSGVPEPRPVPYLAECWVHIDNSDNTLHSRRLSVVPVRQT